MKVKLVTPAQAVVQIGRLDSRSSAEPALSRGERAARIESETKFSRPAVRRNVLAARSSKVTAGNFRPPSDGGPGMTKAGH